MDANDLSEDTKHEIADAIIAFYLLNNIPLVAVSQFAALIAAIVMKSLLSKTEVH